jgi:GNAT superfamily N-acetyltransferase
VSHEASTAHSLERVTEDNLTDVVALAREYCRFNGVECSDAALLALFRALVADPAREGVQFLARDATGRAAGFATLVWSWATWATGRIGIMADLYVAAHARRRGIAQTLIEACHAECRMRGARGLTWSTAEDNAPARALYDRVGAQSRTNWVDYWLDS